MKKQETTSIQITKRFHKQLCRDFLKTDKYKTFEKLLSYYRKLALQFIKQTK